MSGWEISEAKRKCQDCLTLSYRENHTIYETDFKPGTYVMRVAHACNYQDQLLLANVFWLLMVVTISFLSFIRLFVSPGFQLA